MAGPTGEQDWYLSGVFSMSFINLNDTFGDYIDRAGLVPKVNAAEDTLIPSDAEIDSHAVRHKDGGPDELDVVDLAGAEGLSGQVPETDGAVVTWVNLAHGNLSGVSYNDHHSVGTGIIWDVDNNVAHDSPAVHEAGGALEVTHNNLVLASDDHHAKYTDAEAETAINNDADHGSTAQHNYFSGDHADLTNVLSDQHHAKYIDAEAIAAVEGNANTFTTEQEIKGPEASWFLYLTDSDTGNQLIYIVGTDGVFYIRGYRANDDTNYDLAIFHPAAGYWELGVQIPRGNLKTSSGSVSEADNAGGNKTLPGGEYGFYPQLKHSNSSYYAYWGYNVCNSKEMQAAKVQGTTYKTTLQLCNGQEGVDLYAYARQRYVTSSGEIHWLFVQRYKNSFDIKSVWQAPDHPCFGNGGKPEAVPHPFGDFDPAKHELIVINPSFEQVWSINRALLDKDGMENGLDFIEAMFQLYDIVEDETVKWSDIPVTIGLTSEYSDNPRQPVKKPIPACPYAKMGRLNPNKRTGKCPLK